MSRQKQKTQMKKSQEMSEVAMYVQYVGNINSPNLILTMFAQCVDWKMIGIKKKSG